MFLISIRTSPMIMPSVMAMPKTTNTAKRAVCGYPAPSSFETLMLNRENKNMLEYMQGFEFPLDHQVHL